MSSKASLTNSARTLLRRNLRHHRPETVALLTSLPPEELDATQWLKDNRAAWGIETGLHQRLDVSHLDDLCRVRTPRSMRVAGMLHRFRVTASSGTGAAFESGS